MRDQSTNDERDTVIPPTKADITSVVPYVFDAVKGIGTAVGGAAVWDYIKGRWKQDPSAAPIVTEGTRPRAGGPTPIPDCSNCHRPLNVRESDLKTPYLMNNSGNKLIVNMVGENRWRCPWPGCHFVNQLTGTFVVEPYMRS